MVLENRSWLLVPALLTLLSPSAYALMVVVETKVDREYLKRNATGFTVQTAERDGNVEFEIRQKTDQKWRRNASLIMREDGRQAVQRPVQPKSATDVEVSYSFVVSREYLDASEFVLSEHVVVEVDGREVGLPGGRIWRFHLADFHSRGDDSTGVRELEPAAATSRRDSKIHAAPQQPSEGGPLIELSELTPDLDGQQVVVRFEVATCYRISGAVPTGQVASFGIDPVLPPGSPRFMVLVSGDLADLMTRFGCGPHPLFSTKGLVMEASGKIKLFPAREEASHEGPSYQFNIRDWRGFRITRMAKPPGAH